jgi:hypothetical protein
MIKLHKYDKNMKHISIFLASLFGIALLTVSCNDEWKDEQFTQYVSFKASLNDNGVTSVYVPYTRHDTLGNAVFGAGISSYQLPVIISGSKTNGRDITVHVAHDTDTLGILNYARFQNRTDLYYVDMNDYAKYPETVTVKSGEDVGLLDVRLNFANIDMVNKWVLPIMITDDPSNNYVSHPRKNYAKAMLRIYPFNDYSGDYSATTLTVAMAEDPTSSIGMETSRAYVVNDSTVFFYAGTVDETRTDRSLYKIYFTFCNDTQGTVKMWSNNPDMKFQQQSVASWKLYKVVDQVQPYLVHRYIIINNIKYTFSDYTLVKGFEMNYLVSGTLTLERKINTQIPDEDQAIQW